MFAQTALVIDPLLDAALVTGGDDRLAVSPDTGMNLYGCTPHPRPGEISMSSTTATTISVLAYEAAARTLALVRPEAPGASRRYESAIESVRASLKRSFDWTDEEIVLSPSGTDAEVLLLYLVQGILKRPLAVILVSSDETGTGVDLAASGRHFSNDTSSGQRVRKGDPIGGPRASIIKIPTRGKDGKLLPIESIDETVLETVALQVNSGRDVLLHVMHHSKTGASGPSKQCLSFIKTEHPSNLQIVVDVCQARASRAELRDWLASECILLITGSKFFAGPPLSGALVLPATLVERLRRLPAITAGLGAYSTPYDWPTGWTQRDELPQRINVGQLLRWTAALTEIERYFTVPLFFREQALSSFEQALSQSLRRHNCVELLDPVSSGTKCDSPRDEFRFRSVFPFTVWRHGNKMGEADSRVLHRALNADVSDIGSNPAVSQCCHIGQPVVIRNATSIVGALRISADARFVAECWHGGPIEKAVGRLHERCAMVDTVFEKVSFLVSRFDRLQRFCVATDPKVVQ